MDTALVRDARVFVDSRAGALAEAGDLVIPIKEGAIDASHIAGELGDVFGGRMPGRRNAAEITIFKSLGMAVEDVAAARLAFERASERGAGKRVRASKAVICRFTLRALLARSAQRFFIISEMRFGASGDILRRRRLRPVPGGGVDGNGCAGRGRGAADAFARPTRVRSWAACAVSAASRVPRFQRSPARFRRAPSRSVRPT